jgi:hypothetical protein
VALGRAASESALWATVASLIFIVTRIYRSRKGQHCELCGDTPGGQQSGACEVRKPGRES